MTETLRRITPKEAAALFTKHGVKPVRSQHLDPDLRSGGVLGVLALDMFGPEKALQLIDDARKDDSNTESRTMAPALGLDPDYASGLSIAFSDHWSDRDITGLVGKPWFTPAWRVGFEDGRAIRMKVKPW